MYEVNNGILYKNGKKTYVLGQSYYPSFHPCKFPVEPEGDRIGEMKKDLRMMSEAGFNHVRMAALGDVGLDDNGELKVDTPFIDAMIEEADKNDISVSIRQQGFSVNLRNFEDADMVDWDGNPPSFAWHDFVRTTLNHEGILEDNRTYAKGLAAHFAKFDNVIGFQIYNEPKHPRVKIVFFDYNPKTIETYRKWLVERNIMTGKEAAIYEPPRRRNEQTHRMWALWRLFSRDNLTAFLNNASAGSKEGAQLPTFTCFTSAQISANNVYAGNNMFDNAKTMDIVGYTTYIHANGVGYYPMCFQADLAQCAAEAEKKHSWCIELDSRTYIPCSVYNRGTYAILGSGCKGIVYYQWRGDCPVPGVPRPNSCGILNYDGTKTNNFDNAVNVNRFIARMNDLIVNADRVHEGVGLFHSDYATFLCDARENHNVESWRGVKEGVYSTYKFQNSYMVEYSEIYRQLRNAGHNVSIIDGSYSNSNPFEIKVLYVPHINMLSPEEKEKLDGLVAKGVRVFENGFTASGTSCIGFKEYPKIGAPRKEDTFNPQLSVYDVAEMTGIQPMAVSLEPNLGIQMLEGQDYKLIVLTNLSGVKEEICAKVRLHIPFDKATFSAIDGDKPIKVEGDTLTVEHVTDGGIIVIK